MFLNQRRNCCHLIKRLIRWNNQRWNILLNLINVNENWMNTFDWLNKFSKEVNRSNKYNNIDEDIII